jgi:thermitase
MHIPRAVAIVLGTLVIGTSAIGAAAPQKLVVPGREIAVVFKQRPGMSAQARRSIVDLKVPTSEKVLVVDRRGQIGVLGLSSARVSTFASKRPVVAQEGAIKERCDEIVRLNPQADILCEPNVLFHKSAIPNDPRYSRLYGISKIKAPLAWDTSTGSSSVRVAVVDTGIDYGHSDLNANIAPNTAEVPNNGVDDDGNGYVDDFLGYNFAYGNADPYDDDGHGTHCAGTIGARGNNGVGVAGVNWQVGLIPVKVLDSEGAGYLSDIAAGISYAIARNVAVISMSLGGPDYSAILENAIGEAKAANIVVVVAAGNETTDNDRTPSYPANSMHNNVISVAATDSADALADFSNWGLTTVHVAAPGEDIESTVPGGYATYSGTSMATPHVAGLAALIKASNPALSSLQIKSIILETADPIRALSTKVSSGGRINAAAALARATGVTPAPANPVTPTDPSTYYLSLSVKRRGATATLSGRMIDAENAPVVGEYVELICAGQVRGARSSSSSGGYSFRLKRSQTKSTRATKCRVENIYGESSRTLRAW